jgi:RNA polymerase sigma factor (sigma-70 family)
MADMWQPSEQTAAFLDLCLVRLATGDSAARDALSRFALDRMQTIAHRMLQRFPNVRRWEDTDDVVQNASLRLHRTLSQLTPRDPRGFLGLVATHIRRELIDLARKHAGPESYAANHESNVQRTEGHERLKIDLAPDQTDSLDLLDRWTRMHEAADSLPSEERELFHLAWYLGMQQAEIGKLLGCSVRTVKRRWESAKQLLNEAVSGERPQ